MNSRFLGGGGGVGQRQPLSQSLEEGNLKDLGQRRHTCGSTCYQMGWIDGDVDDWVP